VTSGKLLIGKVVDPPAKVIKLDWPLTFTIILFGFVIRELFLRLQSWGSLAAAAKWQLIVGMVLVLGSWIGFSGSLNRSGYQPKVFNLPLLRFVLDQGMVIVYFRIAVLIPMDLKTGINVGALANDTLMALVVVFVLYWIWDLLGIWMASVTRNGGPKYGKTTWDSKKNMDVWTNERIAPNWPGLVITFVAFGLMVLIAAVIYPGRNLDEQSAERALMAATVLLVIYRFAKEVRTSWM